MRGGIDVAGPSTSVSQWEIARRSLLASLLKTTAVTPDVAAELHSLFYLSFPFPWLPSDTKPEREELARRLLTVARRHSTLLLAAGRFVLERGGLSVETEDTADQVRRALISCDEKQLEQFAKSDSVAILSAIAVAAILAAAKGRSEALDVARSASLQVRLQRSFIELDRLYSRKPQARRDMREAMRELQRKSAAQRIKKKELPAAHILRGNIEAHVAMNGSIRGLFKVMRLDYKVDNRTIKKHAVEGLNAKERSAFEERWFLKQDRSK